MGAKNHATILPDADKESSLNDIVGAAFGAAGQRCMALSTCIFVVESQKWFVFVVYASVLTLASVTETGTTNIAIFIHDTDVA